MMRRVLVWIASSIGFGWAASMICGFVMSFAAPEFIKGFADLSAPFRAYSVVGSVICAAACFHIWRKS